MCPLVGFLYGASRRITSRCSFETGKKWGPGQQLNFLRTKLDTVATKSYLLDNKLHDLWDKAAPFFGGAGDNT